MPFNRLTIWLVVLLLAAWLLWLLAPVLAPFVGAAVLPMCCTLWCCASNS